MKERPILMSAPMVRAILDDSKTHTRRIAKFFNEENQWNDPDLAKQFNPRFENGWWKAAEHGYECKCPFGEVGDLLWVKETFLMDERNTKGTAPQEVVYDATPEWAMDHTGKIVRVRYLDDRPVPPEEARRSIDCNRFWHKKPSIFMPRWASRITLEITGIRVERLNDISEEDAKAEGTKLTEIVRGHKVWHASHRAAFASLWQSINGPGSWAKNPWTWVIEFKRI